MLNKICHHNEEWMGRDWFAFRGLGEMEEGGGVLVVKDRQVGGHLAPRQVREPDSREDTKGRLF